MAQLLHGVRQRGVWGSNVKMHARSLFVRDDHDSAAGFNATDTVALFAPGALTAGQRSPSAAATILAGRIERAHQDFIQRTRKKIVRATELTSAIRVDEAQAKESALKELYTLAHSLAGTAGSFGYAGLSEAAEALEEAVQSGQEAVQSIPGLVIEMAYEFLDSVAGTPESMAR